MHLHVITGLSVGGAEIALRKLIFEFPISKVIVVSLTTIGEVGQTIESNDYKVIHLNLKKYNFFLVFYKLYKIIKFYNPSIVQTWLYHADLLGGLAARFAGVKNVVWGIRTTELKKGSRLTSWLRIILARLSYTIPAKIVLVADSAMKKHISLGYDQSKMVVIPNGFGPPPCNSDTRHLEALNALLLCPTNDIVIGCIGRFSPVKGQDIFIRAAGIILRRFPSVKFLMVGRGLDTNNREICSLIESFANLDNFILMGELSDTLGPLKHMDIFCLPSRSEGFPNALGEAMLAAVPCVATDAGDAAVLGGHDVPIAKIEDPQDLANKLISILMLSKEERRQIGQRLQQRVITQYSMDKMKNSYQTLYRSLESFS